MTNQRPSDEEIALFARLFGGYENAHGHYEINRSEDSGKVLGKAMTHKRPASTEDYARHLSGSVGIGIIPLLKSDKCNFGCIDIDIKGDTKLHETHEELEHKVRQYKLPLMMFRSKSNGAHLYFFAKEPISARLIQNRLAEFAALLGYGGCEVFPKQVTRINPEDDGNWINIPLFGDTRTGYFEGKDLDRKSSLHTCEYLAMTEAELRAFSCVQSDHFADGPPCLQQLATLGIGEGARNNILFNAGLYYKMKDSDSWQEELRALNDEFVDPPLPSGEMGDLIKQLANGTYYYTCKQSPICNFCDKKKCLKRQYGVGKGSKDSTEEFHLPITSLTKYIAGDRQSYRWGVSTTEAMLEFSTDELLDINVHRRKFAELMSMIIPQMKVKQFNDQLQELMNKAEVIYDPEDASEEGELISNIESWFTDKGSARNADEMIKRIWWRNELNGFIYFQGTHLIDYLVHQKKMRNVNRHKLWRLLETRFKADKGKLLIKKKRRNVYILKDFAPEDLEPLEIPDVEMREKEI